ncbi:MAG: hypothetical protein Q7S96_04295 [bacterium]|nr:hypothetical protein [bacterium]
MIIIALIAMIAVAVLWVIVEGVRYPLCPRCGHNGNVLRNGAVRCTRHGDLT